MDSYYFRRNHEEESRANTICLPLDNGQIEPFVLKRRSSRNFNAASICRETIETILTAGTLAPSGKNSQPWKFAVIHNDKELLKKISALTVYNGFVSKADCLVAIYLDKAQSYHYIKDIQAIGACIENMLLQATALGIGSYWIGEILNRAAEVNALLDTDNNLELMAVVAFGVSDEKTPQPKKKGLDECLLKYL